MTWVTHKIITQKMGITKAALDTKRYRGILIEGVHWKKAIDNVIYYNIKEINNWINEC
ncbi:excisionase family protein [Pseudomonadota bacterium]